MSELSEKENFWLRNLTNDLKTIEEANKILSEYQKNHNDNNHKSVMNAIVSANKELFREATKMCEALIELMKEELKEELKEEFDAREKAGEIVGREVGRIAGKREERIQLIQTKLSKGKSVEAIAEDLEDTVENILALIKEMDKEKVENK